MEICMTPHCNERAVPGSDYCLACLSRQNGHGSDGAAMVIPPLATLNPCVVELDGDVPAMLAIAEQDDRLKRLKAELNRQRDRFQDQKGDLLRAQYANEQQDETIRQMAETISRQSDLIRRQQAKLDGRMTAIRELRVQLYGTRETYLLEREHTEYVTQQLEQLRSTLMQVPFAGSNGQGEWVQTARDDVAPLASGFTAQYAKLDPDTFEIHHLYWYRAE